MPAPVNGVERLPGGRCAGGTSAARLDVVDLRRREVALRWPLSTPVPQLAVRHDGTMVAHLTERTLSVFELPSRRRVVERAVDGPRRGLAFWPDDLPETQVRCVQRIRLGTVPAESPMLSP